MKKVKIGLLPLYLELYDNSLPQLRPRVEGFLQTICTELESRNIEVERVSICRVSQEFHEAITKFEGDCVDAIVTLHLAYSPSLESAPTLIHTKLPVIVLDTTPAFGFGALQDPDEILYNHGIHGVQDLCNLLRRNRKEFLLEAGHWKESDVLDRVSGDAKAAALACFIRNIRVGSVGGAFFGMGDFAVPTESLQSQIGIETIFFDASHGKDILTSITQSDIIAEMLIDQIRFDAACVDCATHERSVLAGLAIRRWMEQENLSALTVNFLAVNRALGLPCMPFLEAGKAMARGQGYAGEGDVLTAALVGTLLQAYKDTSFVEMFCPDWEGGNLFLSHMGEMNPALTAEKPRLHAMDFPYADVEKPAVAHGRFREGDVVLVNLAPAEDGTYTLIVSQGHMLGVDGEDRMSETVHGWFRPEESLEGFLTAYSEFGGTHHAALVYSGEIDVLQKFGRIMGWKVRRL
jgi:L-arabinose isomerase